MWFWCTVPVKKLQVYCVCQYSLSYLHDLNGQCKATISWQQIFTAFNNIQPL